MADKRKLQGEIFFFACGVKRLRWIMLPIGCTCVYKISEFRKWAVLFKSCCCHLKSHWNSGIFTADDIRRNTHHICCLLVSLNASFCVYLKFTDLTFITTSVNTARVERQTFMNFSESRSFEEIFSSNRSQLVSMWLSSCTQFQWLLLFKTPPNIMRPNVWSFSERLFI